MRLRYEEHTWPELAELATRWDLVCADQGLWLLPDY
jgi:hypothetical protein